MKTLDFSCIKSSKNLLAFSSGVDSTALFFLLLNSGIKFDIAIVNYNVRKESKLEVEYAKELAKKYDKKIFVKDVVLKSTSNFEKVARDIRYSFFEELIFEYSYETLLTAHQLNDKFEWFLMQLSKGAGICELLGMKEFEDKNTYKIYRPLLNIAKKHLQNYLDENGIKYFVDKTNFSTKYRRNYLRSEFSNRFLDEFEVGVENSFCYLNEDLNSLKIDFNPILEIEELEIFRNHQDSNLNIKVIDKSLKKRGILLTKAQRDEIIKQKELTISHKVNIAIGENFIYIAPKVKATMSKDFKEKCRKQGVAKNIREYLFFKNIKVEELIF